MVLLTALVLSVPIAWFARAARKSWLAPDSLFALYWVLALVLPIALYTRDVSNRSIELIALYVAVYVLAFQVGMFRAAETSDQPRHEPGTTRLRIIVVAGTLTGLAATVLSLRHAGISLSNVTSLGGLLSTGNSLAVDRYAAVGTQGPGIESALLLITYAAAISAPFLRGERRLLLVGPIIASLVYAMVTTARLPFLITTALWVSGYLGNYLVSEGRPPTLGFRRLLRGVALGLVVAAAFAGIAFVRVGRTDSGIRPVIEQKLDTYAFGYLPALSEFLDMRDNGSTPQLPLGYGTSSIAGVQYLTGQSRAATRAYGDAVFVGDNGQSTNIYSIWRSLILDFGIAGTAIVMALLGFVCALLYRAALRGSLAAATATSSVFGIILLSSVMPITTFTNVCAGMVLAILVVRPQRARRVRSDPMDSYVGAARRDLSRGTPRSLRV